MEIRAPRVSLVILNWLKTDETLACLGSLRAQDHPSCEVVVVDNGSPTGSRDRIRREFPEVTLIENGRNLGFAAGNNVGIAYLMRRGVDYVLLLNDDTEVAPDMLDRLRRGRRGRGRRRGPGPKIYYYARPNVIWSAGGAVDAREPPPPGRPAGRRRLETVGTWTTGHRERHPGQAPGDRAGRATGRALLHLLRGDGVVRPGAPGRLSRPLRAPGADVAQDPLSAPHSVGVTSTSWPATACSTSAAAEPGRGPPGALRSTSYARRAGRCAPATGSSARSPQRSSTACATSSQDGWDPHRQASVHLDGTGETLIKGLKRPVLVTGGPLVSGFDSDLATATMGGCRNATFDNCYQFDSRAIRNRSCGRAASENRLCGTLKTAFHELHRLYV